MKEIKNIIWFEKYRPDTFKGVVGLPSQLEDLNVNKMPHMLFVGKPGIGKTTCAIIIADVLKAELLELNASDERGIDIVRHKVKFFAQRASFGLKVILLDEADGITPQAQDSLRRTMESCSDTTLFILTANYKKRIIPAIQSRCTIVEFPNPQKVDIRNRLKFICRKEGVEFKSDDLDFIIRITYPDIRKAINLLQNLVKKNKLDISGIQVTDDVLEAIWLFTIQKEYGSLRLLLNEYTPDYDQVYIYLFNKIFELDMKPVLKKDALLKIAERMWRNTSIADPEINFMAFVFDFDI